MADNRPSRGASRHPWGRTPGTNWRQPTASAGERSGNDLSSPHERDEDAFKSSGTTPARQTRQPPIPVSQTWSKMKVQDDDSPSVDVEASLEKGNKAQADEQKTYDSDDSVGDKFGGIGRGRDIIDTGLKSVEGSMVMKLPPITEAEFYSNLVFLSILSPTVGPPVRRAKDVGFMNNRDAGLETQPPGRGAQKELQRDFLDRLCYLADFKKGGDSITAAAIRFEFVQQGARSGGGGGQETRQQQQQQQHQQPATQIIWFAANAGVSAPAWEALREVERLIQRNRREDLPRHMIAQEISETFIFLASCDDPKQCCNSRLRSKEAGIPKGTHRINFYAKEMRKYGKKALELLQKIKKNGPGQTPVETASGTSDAVKFWIHDLRQTTVEMDLVDKCYRCWYEQPYKDFLKDAKQSAFADPPEAAEVLRQFAHYVARLGAHKYAALKVAEGIKHLSYMGTNQNCFVKFDRLPRFSHQDGLKPTIINLFTASKMTGGSGSGSGSDSDSQGPSHLDPWNIIHRLSSHFPGDGPKLAGGYLLEEERRGQENGTPYSFRDEIETWTRRRDGALITRYHVELQVAYFFNAREFPFQNHDRYLGCGKGACWFCFHYLTNLPVSRAGGSSPAEDGFVEPTSHNEVLPGVSFPPTKSDGSKEIVVRMMFKMNDLVLQKMRNVLLDNVEQFSPHHQSTNTWMDRLVAPSSWMDEEGIVGTGVP